MKLGAVVVSHNSAAELPGCLEALERTQSEFTAGILVIDNASTDASAKLAGSYSFAKVYASPENLGFAGAVNLAFDILQPAEAILVLNPDTHVLTSPSILAAGLVQPRVAAAAGQLLNESGKPQSGFQVRRFPTAASLAFEVLGVNRLWPGNPVNRRWRALDFDAAKPAWVEQPAGACLLVLREAWRDLGGFDEGFHPVWFEDVDFLRRATAAGWRVRYNPDFRARHLGGHSVSKVCWTTRQLYWYGSVLRYASRHLNPPGRTVVCLAVMLGLVPRLVMGIITERSSQVLSVCGRLMRLAFSYLSRGIPEEGPRRTERKFAVGDCGPLGS